ncbi:MAG: TetR/AcrR family transcriptional regulator [Candidatus Margulisbacteria bacterium]|nr:TetR/AcrR family transcriptional regulator [Candidatus Margulisiibacteriota bacterium]
MRTSKQTQEKTRLKLIHAGIVLMTQNGYAKTTMRDISKHAKLSDTTIYRYFPTKDALVLGYIHLRHEEAIAKAEKIKDWSKLTLQEKLHTYFETILEGFLPERDFIQEAFEISYRALLTNYQEIRALNTLFLDHIRHILRSAIQKKEIPEQPIETVIPHLILDAYLLIALYWAKDTSKGFTNTTQIIDMSTGIMTGLLRESTLQKTIDLGYFLFRNHLFAHFNFGKEGPLNAFYQR